MPSSFGIGIPCYNEAQNIRSLLEVLSRQFSNEFMPVKIILVSSAATDGTDEIVSQFIDHSDLPIVLISQAQRLGKASSVNRIIQELENVEIIFLISGDVLPETGCLKRLLDAFADPEVGVVGGRPVPDGSMGSLAFRITQLLWDLHHIIVLSKPKTTEITAFKNLNRFIDENSLVDEAELEWMISGQGLRVVYVPEAVIRTQSPLTLRDYIRHRTRVMTGHILLARRKKYSVGTLSLKERFHAIRSLIRQKRFPYMIGSLAVLLEGFIFLRAYLLTYLQKSPQGSWKTIRSAKRPFNSSKFE